MIKFAKIFKQETNITCGPACIKTILNFYNLPELEEQYIANLAHTNQDIGTSREDLENTLNTLGLKTHSQFEGSLLQLQKYVEEKIPVIVYYWSEDESDHSVSWFHYSIVAEITSDHIGLADPWTGRIEILPIVDFLDLWYCDNGKQHWLIAVEK